MKAFSEEQNPELSWLPYAAFLSTGSFSHLGKGFVNHCGPTAITNVVLTLQRRLAEEQTGVKNGKESLLHFDQNACEKKQSGRANKEAGGSKTGSESRNVRQYAGKSTAAGKHALPPAQRATDEDRSLFLEIARFGMHHLIYYNFSFFHLFGGTSDFLSGLYLRSMLKKHVPGRTSVSIPRPLRAQTMIRELRKGHLLYIQVIRHPKYKNHHFLCYGVRPAEPEEKGRFAFICADGWSLRPVILSEREFFLGSFRGIGVRPDADVPKS